MEKKSKAVVEVWTEAVNRGDLEAVLDLYSDDAVLLPTFSNRIRNTKEGLRGYFSHLGELEQLKVTLDEASLSSHELPGAGYYLAGLYDWEFDVDGELCHVNARFSFVMNLDREKPIVHHHSSAVPDSE